MWLGMTVADGKVFVFGADRYAFWDKTKPVPSCGSFPPMLYELNPDDLAAGWLSHPFPGGDQAMGAGIATSGNHIFLAASPFWKFDLATAEWSKLPDSPVAQISGFTNANNAIFQHRYMILIGGCEITNYRKGDAPASRKQCYTGSPGWGSCGCGCGNKSSVQNVSAIRPGTCGVPVDDWSLPQTCE